MSTTTEFKVGDKIKYIGSESIMTKAKLDIGKVGTIVDIEPAGFIKIHLPESTYVWGKFHSKSFTWRTAASRIQKFNPQLLLWDDVDEL